MRVDIYIQDTKLDLFEDENVELNSAVALIEDITKNVTDVTKDFTLPASKENNKLFKHWYNAGVDNSFDARIKVEGRIELDGMIFRKGKFRLAKVSLKNGKPKSYTVVFWGNLLSLKDKLNKDELNDLDLTAFNHSYDSANVKLGLTDELFSGDIVYNLFAKRQYYYNSDASDTTIIDELTNIGWGDGSGSNGVLWNELNPALKAIRIIEAIETDYDITFSRDFFGRTEFTNLYVWMNNTKDVSIGGGSQTIDWDGGDSTHINLGTNLGSYPVSNTSASCDDLTWTIKTTITPSAGYETVEYTLKLFVDGNEYGQESSTGTDTIAFDRLRVQNAPDNPHDYSLEWVVDSNQEFKYTASVEQQRKLSCFGIVATYVTTATENTISSNFEALSQIPKIKTIDFLKGLFKMFKLVVIPENDGSLYVNTFDSFYAEGNIIDITQYVDNSNYEVQRGKILNEINYVFEEPQTILNVQFEENTRIAYGDSETTLKDDNGKLLDGTKLEYKVPFEQILYERLKDQNDDVLTNIQYGAIIDESLSPVNPKLHLFYNISQSIGAKTIGFINDVSVKEELSGNINIPSHTIGLDISNFSTLFDAEFSTWNGNLINNTLYKNYHENYILSIFNVKKREYSYDVKNLPLRIMLDLRLNDLLKIKETYYRINDFTTNLLDGSVKLNLISSFDSFTGLARATPLNHFVDSNAQQINSYVDNIGTATTGKIDTGSGVSWVTISQTGGNLYFDIDENETGLERNLIVDVKTSPAIEIYINQDKGKATFDSTIITFDSTIITFDNN